jgi:hypothetical protein
MIGWIVSMVMACGSHQAVGWGHGAPAVGYMPQQPLSYNPGPYGQLPAPTHTMPMQQLPPRQP